MAAASCFGEQKSFPFVNGKVSVDIPTGWTEVVSDDNVMMMGPEKSGTKPVVMIVPMGGEVDAIQLTNPMKEEQAYRKGRLEWLEKQSGKPVSWFPMREVTLAAGINGFENGYRYSLKDPKIIYSESSTYVVCGGNMYLLTSLLTYEEEKTCKNVINGIYSSFDCK
jgi:hypothetical protein